MQKHHASSCSRLNAVVEWHGEFCRCAPILQSTLGIIFSIVLAWDCHPMQFSSLSSSCFKGQLLEPGVQSQVGMASTRKIHWKRLWKFASQNAKFFRTLYIYVYIYIFFCWGGWGCFCDRFLHTHLGRQLSVLLNTLWRGGNQLTVLWCFMFIPGLCSLICSKAILAKEHGLVCTPKTIAPQRLEHQHEVPSECVNRSPTTRCSSGSINKNSQTWQINLELATI